MDMEYRIRVGTVAYTTHDGWRTMRQVPEFSVRAACSREAARKARSIMLAGADDTKAVASFGMLDANDNYWTDRDDHHEEEN